MRISSPTSICLALILCLSPAVAAGQTEEANRVFTQTSPGTLAIIAYDAAEKEIGRGTAFALGEDLLATAYHLVSKAASVKAVNTKGKEMKVDGIIAVDKAADVAILKLKGKAQTLALGTIDTMKEGSRIFAVGANEGGQITNTEGTFRRVLDIGGELKLLEMSLTITNTYCGAPLTDFASQVVGMILVLDRGLRAGIPVNVFMNVFQNAARTAKPTSFEAWPKEDYFETLEGALLCGRLAAKLDDLTTARLNLEKVARLNPNQVEAQALLADIYLRQRDYSAAVPAFQKALELDGSQANVAYGLGISLMRTQKFAEAAAAMEKAITLNVATKEVFFDLGSVYEEQRDFAKAAEAYVRFLETKPVNSANGYLRLGMARMQLQQFEGAVEALLETQKIQPQDIKTNYSLAEALWRSGQFDLAEQTYRRLAEINPQDATVYYGQIVKMYDEVKQNEKAIAAAQKIVEINPQSELALYNLGIMYFKIQRYEEAVAQFRRCLEISPNYTLAWFNLGFSYYNMKRYPESIEAYKKFVEISPDDASGWSNIGISYMMLKQFENALQPMEKAVELSPNSATTQYNLAVVYINLGDNYSARAIYRKLQTLDPALAERLRKLMPGR